jgi:OmpA-OmpF porin, OOP family
MQLFEGVPSIDQLRDALLPPEAEADEPIVTRGIKIGRREFPPKPRSIEASIGEPGMKSPPAVKPVVTNPSYEPGVAFLINFGFDSAALPAGSLPQLDQMASLLRQEKALVLGVEGHTDAVGPPDYNLDLSRRRANAVARYLEQRGVPVEQLISIGRGKTEPLLSDPYDGKNRRVQFSRISFAKAP